jgi:CelD/BcsL family acetyltransferase involved in cellulose biosynthesis
VPANINTKPNVTVRRENLETLGEDWSDLYVATKSDNPFLSWEWFLAWRRMAKSKHDTCILVARENGKLVGIAPLSLNNRRLSFFRDPLLANYTGLLIRPGYETARIALVNHICRMPEWRTASLDSIRSVSGILPLLDAQFTEENLLWRRETICANPRIATTGKLSTYMKGRKKRLRQEIRTTENNLAKGGGWRFREASNIAEAIGIFDALVRFHTNRQSEKVGNPIFAKEATRRFFADLIRSPAIAFEPHLSAIDFGGRIVSAVYSLRCGKSFYYWIPSFDSSIRSVSLGKLHLKCLIEVCFTDGTDWFDFMGGEEPYKFQWADESYELCRYRIHRNRTAALFDLQRERLLTSLKTLRSRSPALQAIWHRVSKLRG